MNQWDRRTSMNNESLDIVPIWLVFVALCAVYSWPSKGAIDLGSGGVIGRRRRKIRRSGRLWGRFSVCWRSFSRLRLAWLGLALSRVDRPFSMRPTPLVRLTYALASCPNRSVPRAQIVAGIRRRPHQWCSAKQGGHDHHALGGTARQALDASRPGGGQSPELQLRVCTFNR